MFLSFSLTSQPNRPLHPQTVPPVLKPHFHKLKKHNNQFIEKGNILKEIPFCTVGETFKMFQVLDQDRMWHKTYQQTKSSGRRETLNAGLRESHDNVSLPVNIQAKSLHKVKFICVGMCWKSSVNVRVVLRFIRACWVWCCMDWWSMSFPWSSYRMP